MKVAVIPVATPVIIMMKCDGEADRMVGVKR